MNDAFALLWPPFLVAVCLVAIHTYFGIQVIQRNVIFVDLALAQIAALGATAAFMLGHPAQGVATYGYSLAFTLIAALLLTFTRAWSARIPQEALIGVFYVVAAAAAILLIDRAPQGAEHLKQILTGNILTTGMGDLVLITPLYAAVGTLHWVLSRGLASRMSPSLLDFLFYASFGVVVTSSVAIAGVLLVFSFLIIPAAIGVLHATGLTRQLAMGWVTGTFASAAGLIFSFAFDLPTGAAMVCTFGAALAAAGVCHALRGMRAGDAASAALSTVRWALVLVLFASATLLIALPRADHPVLDAVEVALPGMQQFYFTSREADVHQDAQAYADRYRREADRLNRIEADSRAHGVALDEMQVRRISSFVRSYGEMQRGEEFVMREVRSRARERVRWLVGAVMLTLAFLLMPGTVGRVRHFLPRRTRTVPAGGEQSRTVWKAG